MSLTSRKNSSWRACRKAITATELQQMIPIKRSTLYDLAQKGRIPGLVRVGSRVYFDLEKVEAWLKAGGHVKRERQ